MHFVSHGAHPFYSIPPETDKIATRRRRAEFEPDFSIRPNKSRLRENPVYLVPLLIIGLRRSRNRADVT